MADTSKRQFVRLTIGTLGLGISGVLAPSRARAQASPSLMLAWGGLGYSVAASEVKNKFPNTVKAIDYVGGTPKVVEKFIASLQRGYLGGNAEIIDITKAIETGSYLIFCVSLDYEQILSTPSVSGDTKNDVESFLYAQAQVLYVEPPTDFRVLYSFPFRVQYNYRVDTSDETNGVIEYSKNFFDTPKSLLSTFQKHISSKQFKESSFPHSLRVVEVSFTKEFKESLSFVGINSEFDEPLVGNAFSSSLAEVGGLSVFPFAVNQLLGGTLSSRFKDPGLLTKISNILDGNEYLDFKVKISMHRLVRKVSGENIANTRIARGMSAFVRVYGSSDELLYEGRVSQISDLVLDRLTYSKNLAAFDLRYIVQMMIKMFDDFVGGVMTNDLGKLSSVGQKLEREAPKLAALKEILLKCVYRG